MAIPTQMVIGKSLPKSLIAEDLLKIRSELISFDSSRILYQFSSVEWLIHKVKSHIEVFTS